MAEFFAAGWKLDFAGVRHCWLGEILCRSLSLLAGGNIVPKLLLLAGGNILPESVAAGWGNIVPQFVDAD